jgi:CDP-2,3-bis-(O-geranylgeranyl)-sn-glycerol synthase
LSALDLGSLFAVAVAFVQSTLSDNVPLRWAPNNWLLIGMTSGAGALGGDALKSFFKRRRGIAPGRPWIPADQLDFVVGALVGLAFVVPLSWSEVVLVVVFTFIADVLVNHISFRIGIRNSAW